MRQDSAAWTESIPVIVRLVRAVGHMVGGAIKKYPKLLYLYWLLFLTLMAAGLYYCSEIISLMYENGSLPLFLTKNIVFLDVSLMFASAALCIVAIYNLVRYFYERNFSLIANFKKSLLENQLEILYQPIVDVKTGMWLGAEALLRWNYKGKNIPPSLFIPLVENSDSMSCLTRWVCKRVVEDFSEIFDFCDGFYISINLSAQDVMDTSFPDFLSKLVVNNGGQSVKLMFEVTENSALDHAVAANNLRRIKSQGHKIALDDFGAGYTSLSYINVLPLDKIKLDRCFMTVPMNYANFLIVESMVRLTEQLNIELIVEGVERFEQFEKLFHLGVPSAQGWLMSKAMRAEDLASSSFFRYDSTVCGFH